MPKTKAQRTAVNAWTRDWRARRVAEGKCANCGDLRGVSTSKRFCQRCLENILAGTRAVRAERFARGRCTACGKHPIDIAHSRVKCRKCARKTIKQSARHALRVELGIAGTMRRGAARNCGLGLLVRTEPSKEKVFWDAHGPEVLRLRAEHLSYRKIGARFGVRDVYVWSALKRFGPSP